MALNEASGRELTGCKVPSLSYFLVQSLKSGIELEISVVILRICFKMSPWARPFIGK